AAKLILVWDALGPMGDERRAHSAAVDPVLEQAKDAVRQPGPASTIAGEGAVVANRAALFSFEAPQAALLAAAVVGHEENERVVQAVRLFERIHDSAHALI